MVDEPRLKLLKPEKSEGVTTAELIQKAKEEVYLEALSIIQDCTHFSEVAKPGGGCFEDTDQETIAALNKWTRQLGSKEKAKRRLRRAQGATLSQKDAPVGINIAKSILNGFVKSEALAGSGHRELNVTFVQMTVQPKEYPVIIDTTDGDKLLGE